MIIDFASIPANTRYHLMTQTLIPRPIAWVLSQNKDESLNLAPFSFFNGVCSNPPLLMLSIGKKASQDDKDTRVNILSGRPFVVHIASVNLAEMVSKTATELAYGDSELKVSHLELEAFPGFGLPRLQDCKVAYGCSLYEAHELGPSKQAVLYAKIEQLFVSDDCVSEQKERYVVDGKKINPLVRLGGALYASLGELFSIARPK